MKFKDKLRVSIFIDPEVVASFRVYALIHKKSLSRFVEELMKKELKNKDVDFLPTSLGVKSARNKNK
jgi:hypothetical protein